MGRREMPDALWYLKAGLSGLIWTAAGGCAAALLLWKFPQSGQFMPALASVIWCLGGFRSGSCAGRHFRRHGMQRGLLCGCLLCMLLGIGCLCMNGSLTPRVLGRCLWVLTGAAAGGIRGVNRRIRGAPR